MLVFFQALRIFYSTLHVAEEGTSSWPLTDALAKSKEVISELRSEKEVLEAQAEQKNKEIEDLKSRVQTLTASSNDL